MTLTLYCLRLSVPSPICRLSTAQLHHPQQDRYGNVMAEAGHFTTVLKCPEDRPALIGRRREQQQQQQ